MTKSGVASRAIGGLLALMLVASACEVATVAVAP